jgi:hypothetical protein
LAVALEFIDFVDRIETIRAKYRGGWERCLSDHANLIGQRVWYDDALFRDGAMSRAGIARLIDEWAQLGFEPNDTVAGEQRWKDVCVVESLWSGPTLPCSWLEVDWARGAGFLRGTAKGPS